MRYLRCQCGKLESWSSMGSPACYACDVCGVTLAESLAGHASPVPHRWGESEWQIDPKTGERWQERVCIGCERRERVTTP